MVGERYPGGGKVGISSHCGWHSIHGFVYYCLSHVGRSYGPGGDGGNRNSGPLYELQAVTQQASRSSAWSARPCIVKGSALIHGGNNSYAELGGWESGAREVDRKGAL